MSKPKVAPARPKGQAEHAMTPGRAIPLSDVTITCYRQPHFFGEEGETPITITGRQLGQIVAWLAQTRPGCLPAPHNKVSDENLWDPDGVALDVEALGEVLRGMGSAELENLIIDVPGVLSLLGDVASDLAARLRASVDGDKALMRATITLPTHPEVPA